MSKPTDRVLEIGTGSGYQAAVLGELAREVYTIEIVPELAERSSRLAEELGYANVHVRAGDGYAGWPEHAPFDAVIVTAAPDHVPQPLVDQLKTGGRLVSRSDEANQDLLVMTKTAEGLREEGRLPVRFVPLTRKPGNRSRFQASPRCSACATDLGTLEPWNIDLQSPHAREVSFHCPVCCARCSAATPRRSRSRSPTPEQFFGFRPGADGELARYPKVLEYFPAAGEIHRSRQVRGARQDDDGKFVCAAADQLATESGAVRSARRDQSAAGRPARPDRRTGAGARGRRQAVLSALRDDPLDRGLQRPGDHAHRPSAGHRQLAVRPRDSRQLGRAARAVAESRWSAPGHRSLVQDERHARSIASTPTSITSTSGTTTIATGSCSRRRKRA